MNEQARRSSPPNRVRPPTDRPFALDCSPPRLTATQLPSATEFVASSGTDFHHANVAPSRAHSFRRKPESRLSEFAWIPARASLGRDDAAGIQASLIRGTAELEGE